MSGNTDDHAWEHLAKVYRGIATSWFCHGRKLSKPVPAHNEPSVSGHRRIDVSVQTFAFPPADDRGPTRDRRGRESAYNSPLSRHFSRLRSRITAVNPSPAPAVGEHRTAGWHSHAIIILQSGPCGEQQRPLSLGGTAT
jgi:hypothetical protein